MRPGLERELKWELPLAAHARVAGLLQGCCGPGRCLDQENRFFDTPGLHLRQAGLALRLRRENQRVLLTVKRRQAPVEAGLHTHDEWETALNASCWAMMIELPHTAGHCLPLPPPARQALAQHPLHLLGSFRNQRLAFTAPGEAIALDLTTFSHHVRQCELEVETDDPPTSRERWTARLQAWNIPWTPMARTKLARMLAGMTRSEVSGSTGNRPPS